MAVAEFETRAYGDGDDSEVNKLLLRRRELREQGTDVSAARDLHDSSRDLAEELARRIEILPPARNPHWPIRRAPTTARPCRRRPLRRAGKQQQRRLRFTASASTRQAGSGKCTWPTIPSCTGTSATQVSEVGSVARRGQPAAVSCRRPRSRAG